MECGYHPEEFNGGHEVSGELEPQAPQPSSINEHLEPLKEERSKGPGTETSTVEAHSRETWKIYEIRGRTYRLRSSKIQTMIEVGKFRMLAFEDLRELAYDGDYDRLRADIENLIRPAGKIERAVGRNLRVVLDDQREKRVYHDLANLAPDRISAESKCSAAERHGFQAVRGEIALPDVRIAYDTPDGEGSRVDVALTTNRNRLREQREFTTEIFSP